MADHRQCLRRRKAIQQVRDTDLQALGEHHGFCVIQPANSSLDLRERAPRHIPASRLAAGRNLLLSEAVRHPQFADADGLLFGRFFESDRSPEGTNSQLRL